MRDKLDKAESAIRMLHGTCDVHGVTPRPRGDCIRCIVKAVADVIKDEPEIAPGWVHIQKAACEKCPTPDPTYPVGSEWVCPNCHTKYEVCRLNGKKFMSANPVFWLNSNYKERMK